MENGRYMQVVVTWEVGTTATMENNSCTWLEVSENDYIQKYKLWSTKYNNFKIGDRMIKYEILRQTCAMASLTSTVCFLQQEWKYINFEHSKWGNTLQEKVTQSI